MFGYIRSSNLLKNNLRKAASESTLGFCRAERCIVTARLLQRGSFTLLIIF